MKDGQVSMKVKSMTGFASVQDSFEDWVWSVEIRAVNGRSLDLRFRLPDVEGLEPALRRHFQSHLGRGNVSAHVKLQRAEGAAIGVVNLAGLAATLSQLNEISDAARQAGLELERVSAADIATMRGVIEASDAAPQSSAALKDAVFTSTARCLELFIEDRAREGAALADVLSEQIDRIEQLIAAAITETGERERAQKANLERALAKLLETSDLPDEARLHQELALIAVKTDVTEELDRLNAHIAEARSLLTIEGPVGRKLDFLMQEFNREANTLCSKSQSTSLTSIGLDLKTVIDQMREQVQNIE